MIINVMGIKMHEQSSWLIKKNHEKLQDGKRNIYCLFSWLVAGCGRKGIKKGGEI